MHDSSGPIHRLLADDEGATLLEYGLLVLLLLLLCIAALTVLGSKAAGLYTAADQIIP